MDFRVVASPVEVSYPYDSVSAGSPPAAGSRWLATLPSTLYVFVNVYVPVSALSPVGMVTFVPVDWYWSVYPRWVTTYALPPAYRVAEVGYPRARVSYVHEASWVPDVDVSHSPQEFTDLVRRETAAWGDFLRSARIQID